MNQNVKITDIISKLNKIDELLKSFSEENLPTGQTLFSTIDKDLILEKIRKLYEIVLLNKSGGIESEIVYKEKLKYPVKNPVKKEEITKPDINVIDSEIDFTEKPIKKPKSLIEEKKTTDTYPSLFKDETINPLAVVKKEENIPVKKEKIETEKQSYSSKTISDQYQENKTQTVSDLMSNIKNNDISTKQNLKPIKNLKSAISINDRIMFTNEIFDNDTDFYNEVVEKINGMNNLNEALEHLGIEININDNSEAIKKFIELVHRRFV